MGVLDNERDHSSAPTGTLSTLNYIRKHFADQWQTAWKNYQRTHDHDPTAAQSEPLQKKSRLKVNEVHQECVRYLDADSAQKNMLSP